ncbi:recQ-mediated genome instability protein 1-like [Dermacentor variabilis]|uniref:recQ-mediated genome instability protein 1-like n=1 Tax=Dermacentor variabilis TaxID=34621 RepID=UPI003F5B6561
MSQVDDLAERFAQQHIRVNRNWLQACASHFQAESTASLQRTAFGGDVYKQVYYQLLLTNLWELGMTCLPESALAAHKLMLKGSFFLQVDSVRDVSQPAYSQLLKITNTENPNTVVQADPIEKPFPWQVQPKRMLKLELTDGTRRMQAIEFEPVRCMSVDMRPGIKILITGPVECRRGVMFLRADNVRILGGMVESLLEENCREAVLCRVIGRDPAQLLDGAARHQTANRSETDSDVISNRQSSNNRTSDRPERVRTTSGSPRTGHDFQQHNDSRVTTIPVANSNSTTVRMSSSVLDAWDRADEADMDPDDVLMSQINLGNLEPEAERPDCIDDDVDEDLLREQLDFQALAAGDGALRDAANSDEEHNAGEPNIESHPSTSAQSTSRNIEPLKEEPQQRNADKQSFPSLPYTQLSSVLKNGKHPDSSEVVIIKGYISTPTSKLKVSPEEMWQLSAIVTDDTASLEVAIDNSLLANWMDLTATEAKKKCKLSSKFKDIFAGKVAQCQEKMRSLNGLLTISFSGRDAKLPVLLDYDEWKQD